MIKENTRNSDSSSYQGLGLIRRAMCLCVLGQDVLPDFSPRPASTQPGKGLRGVRGSS